MILATDVGYYETKIWRDKGGTSFPSIVGTPDRPRFSLNESNDIILSVDELPKRLVGIGALKQSRFTSRKEDRSWINTNEYRHLMATSFSEATKASNVNLTVVTGLPVKFYEKDQEALQSIFLGTHRVERLGRKAQNFTVAKCHVIPQPFGAIFSQALTFNGKSLRNDLMTGKVGIVDIGGKTTNLLSVDRMEEINQETDGEDIGAWDIARKISGHLENNFPGLNLKNHEILEAVKTRKVKYFGEDHDIGLEVIKSLEVMANDIVANMTQLWDVGGRLNAILVSGGGALLLGEFIVKEFKHAYVLDDPVFANSIGYYKYAKLLEKQGKL